jgi:hypothetical protein
MGKERVRPLASSGYPGPLIVLSRKTVQSIHFDHDNDKADPELCHIGGLPGGK